MYDKFHFVPFALFIATFLLGCAGQPPATPTVMTQPTLAVPTLEPLQRLTLVPSPTLSKPAIQTPAWFDDVVMYEIFPRSFYDTNGDGIGDLKGITQKLDYLGDLGVGALWLTPIHPSPSYHGYDITDYYKINPDFGTEQDLIDLVNEAHKRDIKIILDFVAGHTSNQHPFFKDAFANPASKYSKWYRWKNDAQTEYHMFGTSTTLPSLNQDHPETRAYLIDAAKYWIEKANIDGYRLDYALGPSHDFWKAFRAELKKTNPDFLLLGEVWDSMFKIAPYYEDQFDATFDFPTYMSLMGTHERAGKSILLGQAPASAFQTALKLARVAYHPGAQSVRFLNNHDTVRVASQAHGDMARQKLGATLLLTMPGTPMMYYGEEIGMLGDKTDGDKTVREPMEWYAARTGPGAPTWYKLFNKADDGISVEEQLGKKDSLLEHYRALIALRENHPALRHGDFFPLPIPSHKQVIAYARIAGDETFVIVLNPTAESAAVALDLRALAAGNVTLTDMLTADTFPPAPAAAVPLTLAPRSGHILQPK